MKGSKYLCCPNVPIHMSVIEFCEFISPEGSTFTKDISHIRVLKGPDQKSYIIAIKMETKTSAIEFISHYHNKQFSYFEPDLCQLAILSDAYIENCSSVFLEAQECLFQDYMEQVNCPICLEDIFNMSHPSEFLITILCCHTCNWKCLVGWGRNESDKVEDENTSQTCPLCRYY